MIPRGFRRERATSDSSPGRTGTHRLRVAICAGLALVAIALIPAAMSEASAPMRQPVSSAAPAAQAPGSPQNLVSAFTKMQALSNPVERPHHWNESASTYEAPPVAPSDVMTNNWTNVFPILYAISTVSTSEAWAVGEYGHVVHYSGGAWTNVDPLPMRGLSLSDVKFLTATDGYIAGRSKVFHWDGTNWNDMSAGLGTNLFVGRVYPLSDTNIWGVGTTCSGQCLDTVVHWDGTTWTHVGPTFIFSTFFYDIAMASPTDGWVVASDINSNTPYVLHYDGTNWTQFSTPPGATTLYKVDATGVGDVWMISGYNNTSHHIYHYSGGTWTTWQVPDNIEPYGISMLSDTQGYVATGNTVASWDGTNWTTEFTGRWLYDVSAVPGRVWAAGRAETILMRESGPTWDMQRGGPTRDFLFAVSTLPSGEAWAVGQNGTIVKYVGGTWSPVTTTLGMNLWAVKMLSPTDIYIGGDHVFAHCDGTTCTQVSTPTAIISSIFMTGTDQGWAVGTDGSIWQDNAGTWSSVTSPTSLPLYFVTMDSPSHGWAGGGDSSTYTPVLLEYNGTGWADRTSTLPTAAPVLYSLALEPGGQAGWAAGLKNFNNPSVSNAFMRYANHAWTIDQTSPAGSVFVVQLDNNGQAIAIAGEIVGGGIGVVGYHHYGGAWHQESIPTEWCCQAGLSVIPGVGGWSVGPLGNIMRWTSTAGPAGTPTVTPTATITPTNTPPAVTNTPTETATPCVITFTDVHPSDYFYEAVTYLYCHGVISGYADNTFRPYNNTTRGQMTKIVVLGFGIPIWTPSPSATPTFSDVPPDNAFYQYVETAAHNNIVSGYADGTFRPFNNVTRGQLSKIIVIGAVLVNGWVLINPPTATFSDVPANSPFYTYIETAYCHQIISGYADGTFHPNADATRGQISKIQYLAILNVATCDSTPIPTVAPRR